MYKLIIKHIIFDRICGDLRENIDGVIIWYRLAQQVWIQESNPKDWSMTQNNLGGALLDRIFGDRR